MYKDRIKKHTEYGCVLHKLALTQEDIDNVGHVIIEGGVDEVVLINYGHTDITFPKSMWCLKIIKSTIPEITLPWIYDEHTLCQLGTNTKIANMEELINNSDVQIMFTDRHEQWGVCPMCNESFVSKENINLTHICAKRDYGSRANAKTFIEQPLITCKPRSL